MEKCENFEHCGNHAMTDKKEIAYWIGESARVGYKINLYTVLGILQHCGECIGASVAMQEMTYPEKKKAELTITAEEFIG